ncbi:MAG: phosphate propanoyltransferase [Clostridioides sp.]|jgi:propanediol utilization protein|nr:phosphate propanoyltransferase [Clostridioides sp.]
MKNIIDEIVVEVLDKLKKEGLIEVEASGRHVHLSREDMESLFGSNYKLTRAKDLSQPGQYACEERVTITGPRGSIENVVILGPCRQDTQVEVSLTDLKSLGLKAPVRQSGDLEGSTGLKISAADREITVERGLIIAKRHVHITPEDAVKFGVYDNEIVNMKVFGDRPVVFEDVVVRVNANYRTYMHIDYDEANACGFKKGTIARIRKHNL